MKPERRRHSIIFSAILASLGIISLLFPMTAIAEYVVVTDTFEAGTVGNGVVFKVSNNTNQRLSGVRMTPEFPLRYCTITGITPKSAALEPGESVDFTIEFSVHADAPDGAEDSITLFFQNNDAVKIDNPRYQINIDIKAAFEPGDEEEEKCEGEKEKVKGIESDLNTVKTDVEATGLMIREIENKIKDLEGGYQEVEGYKSEADAASLKTVNAGQQIEKLSGDICEKAKKVMNAASLEEAKRLLEQIQAQNNALIKLKNDAEESFKEAGKAADKAEQISEKYVSLLEELESLRGKIDKHKPAVESIGQNIQQTKEAINQLSTPSPAGQPSSAMGTNTCWEVVKSRLSAIVRDYTLLNNAIQAMADRLSVSDSIREWINKIKKSAGEARASANTAEAFYEADQYAKDADKCTTRAREDVDKQRQGTLEKDAKAALQACGFEKARSLIDQMPAGTKKTELEQEYQASVELENRLKALVNKANGEYKGGNYRDAFSTLHDALSEAKCDKHRESINKKIALVNKALLKPYNHARVALQACEFEKARSLIDQIPDGPQKTELEREYQMSMELEDNLKAMVNQARNDYKSCKYDEALAILNKALSQAKCSKHIESIKNKITMAENRKAHEEITQRLHKEAKSLYKRKDYDGALAKLQQAYNHTKCDRYKDSLSSMIAKVQGKRKPSSEEQVAALDCSRYGEAEAYWNESEKKAKCKCKSGYKPSGNRCAPTRETLVQNLDCRAYPNTYAAWDDRNNRAACFCINKNYKWRRDGKGCIPKSGRVVQQDPMCPAAVYAIKNKLRSGDNSGLTLLATNARSMGCTDPVIDQVLAGGTDGGGTGGGDGTVDCSHCKVYEDRLKQLGTGYSGTLRSICENNPECVRWVQEWNQVKKQLRECLAQCQNR